MRSLSRWLAPVAGLAAILVAASAIALAARQDSWAPVISAGWIPAVIAATWPRAHHRCPPRRRGRASQKSPAER